MADSTPRVKLEDLETAQVIVMELSKLVKFTKRSSYNVVIEDLSSLIISAKEADLEESPALGN